MSSATLLRRASQISAILLIATAMMAGAQPYTYQESFSAATVSPANLGFQNTAFWVVDTTRHVLRSTSPGGWDSLSSTVTPACRLDRKTGDVSLSWTVRFPTVC